MGALKISAMLIGTLRLQVCHLKVYTLDKAVSTTTAQLNSRQVADEATATEQGGAYYLVRFSN